MNVSEWDLLTAQDPSTNSITPVKASQPAYWQWVHSFQMYTHFVSLYIRQLLQGAAGIKEKQSLRAFMPPRFP